jgi:hypothetical protein
MTTMLKGLVLIIAIALGLWLAWSLAGGLP